MGAGRALLCRGLRRVAGRDAKTLLWATFPIDGTPAERFSHFVALAKDPATKPDFGAGDMGSVNLAAYDPAQAQTAWRGIGLSAIATRRYRYFLEQFARARPAADAADFRAELPARGAGFSRDGCADRAADC